MAAALTYRALREWLDAIGAGVVGVLPAAEWAGYLPTAATTPPLTTPAGTTPPARSIVLFGAGGPGFLRRYAAHAARHGHLEHWLSDYAQWLYTQWQDGDARALDRYLNPYRSGYRFPFQRGALAAGLGVLGLNNVVLHPEWGPWFSLLGAVVLTEEVPPIRPHPGFDPCRGCHAPCLAACPSGAVSRTGFDGYRCIETKVSHRPCLHACPARTACVLRADLRREMVQLEADRLQDDQATRALLNGFLADRKAREA